MGLDRRIYQIIKEIMADESSETDETHRDNGDIFGDCVHNKEKKECPGCKRMKHLYSRGLCMTCGMISDFKECSRCHGLTSSLLANGLCINCNDGISRVMCVECGKKNDVFTRCGLCMICHRHVKKSDCDRCLNIKNEDKLKKERIKRDTRYFQVMDVKEKLEDIHAKTT